MPSQLSAAHKHLAWPLCCSRSFVKTGPSDRLPLIIILMCQHVCQCMLQVPALNLSSVGRESPTKSLSRALQPAEFDSNSGTALVFKQPKKVNPRSKQHFRHIKVLCKRFLLDVIYDAWKLQAMHRLPQRNATVYFGLCGSS